MNTTPATTPTERRSRPRPAHLCSCMECSHCRKAYLIPQACELPDEEPATAIELTGPVVVFAVFVVSVLSALYLAFSA